MYYNFYDFESLDELTVDEMIDIIVSIFGFEADETIQFCNICEKNSNQLIKYVFKYLINKE